MKQQTLFKVLIAICLAFAAGSLTTPESAIAGVSLVWIYDLIGKLFLNALTLVVVPLVMSSIISGTARIGAEQSLSSLGIKTFGYFIATSFLAVLVGFFLATWITPGIVHDQASSVIDGSSEQLSALSAYGHGSTLSKIQDLLLKLVPANILAAASQGQILGLIFFSMAFGFFSARIDSHAASIMIGFWQGIYQVMMKMIHMVMQALPIGVFGLVAKVVSTTGLENVKPVALLFGTVLLGLAIYAVVVLPLLLKFIARVSPMAHFRALAPALFTAFSTSSSAATLPVTIECLEKNAGVPSRISSFVIPLGASINMAGSALHVCVAVLFIVQTYGIELNIGMECMVIAMAFLMSFGMAGIPSASLVAIVIILQAVDLPPDRVALILAVERILDMFRTATNSLSNATCAVLVASSERKTNTLTALNPA